MIKVAIVLVLALNLGLISANVMVKQIVAQPKVEVEAKPACELCTLVLTAAKNLIDQNKTEDQVLSFIEKELCFKLGSLNATCVQYVEQYGKIIYYELANKIDPSIVCNHIGLCATQNVKKHLILKPMADAGTLNCTLCKLVFQQVKNMLASNQTDEEIIQFIENNLCKATGPLAPVCKEVLEAYGPVIIKELANNVDPEKLCELIGMCTPGEKQQQPLSCAESKVVVSKSTAINPVYCTICQYAVQFLDNELKNNKTEEAIEKALELVCQIAPPSLKPECESIVNTYGIYLVELLIQFGDPTKVCHAIKLC